MALEGAGALNVKQGSIRRERVQIAAANGAVTIAGGVVAITKGTAAAMTLEDPVAGDHDGHVLTVVATTAAAHTLDNSAGSGFNGAGAGADVGTFGGAIGDSIVLLAYGGVWIVLNNQNVTLA